MPQKILVVDDEEALREVLKLRLTQWGYEVSCAESGAVARNLLESFRPDVILSDVVMPELSGLELLGLLKESYPDWPVVLMTAHGTVDMAVEAMKEGAHDFLTKPLDYSKLRTALKQAVGGVRTKVSAGPKRDNSPGIDNFHGLVGRSSSMRRVYESIRSFAETEAAVLISGESGTGKELVARAIHQLSKRSKGPFVPINAAAIPAQLMESEIFGHEKGAFTGASTTRAGCFELADKGTLFLDEIAEMPGVLQPKLLRVLEDGKVRRLGGRRELEFDVRLVAATNRDPLEAIEAKQLREDLFYRLNVCAVELPSLRKRNSDIPLLVEHFTATFNEKYGTNVQGVKQEQADVLSRYRWPGNVRELRNVIERAVILAKEGSIGSPHLPVHLLDSRSPKTKQIVLPAKCSAAEAERRLIIETLESVGGNKAEAARRLGLDVKTIRNKLKTYRAKE